MRAATLWRRALGTIRIDGGTDEQRTKFYTGLDHALLHPNIRDDVDGTYLGYDGEIHRIERGRHFYKNFAGSGWDMYRSQVQLIALAFPRVASDINHSIVLLTEQTGSWTPEVARMQGDNLQVIVSPLDDMGATHYDRGAALRSMVTTQVLPATKSTRTDAYQYFATCMIENRKGDFAASRVLEYAIARLAARLDDTRSHDFFMVRAQNWMNVFDPVTGHIRPRERTGFDRDFDLRVHEDGSGRGQFNQSTGYQNGWLVAQSRAPHRQARRHREVDKGPRRPHGGPRRGRLHPDGELPVEPARLQYALGLQLAAGACEDHRRATPRGHRDTRHVSVRPAGQRRPGLAERVVRVRQPRRLPGDLRHGRPRRQRADVRPDRHRSRRQSAGHQDQRPRAPSAASATPLPSASTGCRRRRPG